MSYRADRIHSRNRSEVSYAKSAKESTTYVRRRANKDERRTVREELRHLTR